MEPAIIIGIALLVVGFLFAAIEIKLPGFGIFGFLSIIMLVVGVVLTAQTAEQGVTLAIIVVVLLAVMITVFLVFMQNKKNKSPLVLNDELTGDGEFLGSDDMKYLVGSVGTATTDLRPQGNISINYVEMEAKAIDGKFIKHSNKIRVVAVVDNKLLVEKM